jgi:hypothetical protein
MGFEVYGSGFKVQGFRFRVQGSWLRIYGFAFQGSRSRVRRFGVCVFSIVLGFV